jgi:hypothetical protein
MTTILHNAATTTVKSPVPFHNVLGCDVYILDSAPVDENERIFIPLNENGIAVVASVVGYTKDFEWRFQQGIFPDLDALLNIVGYGYLSFTQILNHADIWSKLWYLLLSENKIKDITAYDTALTGLCFNKNALFYKKELVYEDDGTTIVTEDDGITYIIED